MNFQWNFIIKKKNKFYFGCKRVGKNDRIKRMEYE